MAQETDLERYVQTPGRDDLVRAPLDWSSGVLVAARRAV